jgi:diadenosine tetraphosphate (Ap4A) HIT family hydrolase
MKTNKTLCPFCFPLINLAIIAENEFVFSIFDIYPVNIGHALIIPKRHFENFFDITNKEYNAVGGLIKQVKMIIDEKYHPDGYNIGININESAGQTVPHCHIHLIPRYKEDVRKPQGGVRHVIPERGYY